MDALCGAVLQLQTLDGRPLSVPLTEPVSPQVEKVVPGEGMPLTKHAGQRGNLRIRWAPAGQPARQGWQAGWVGMQRAACATCGRGCQLSARQTAGPAGRTVFEGRGLRAPRLAWCLPSILQV